MIQVEKVTKKFDDFIAIENIDFSVEAGTIYGLVGYNGAGKTTLLKSIADVYRPEVGRVLVSGEPVFNNAKIKRTMFYVPDDIYFQANASIVKMAKFYKGFYPTFDMKTMEKLVEIFGLDKTAKINGFSKGMQRQAAVILGLATRPTVLLLDESFDGLDPQKRAVVSDVLKEYVRTEQAAVIISSHNLHDLASLSDYIGIINGKQLTHSEKISDLVAGGNRYRVMFQDNIEKADLVDLKVSNFKKDGNLISFTTTRTEEEIKIELARFTTLAVEVFPLTVEEIFLSEMEGDEYDYSKIFN